MRAVPEAEMARGVTADVDRRICRRTRARERHARANHRAALTRCAQVPPRRIPSPIFERRRRSWRRHPTRRWGPSWSAASCGSVNRVVAAGSPPARRQRGLRGRIHRDGRYRDSEPQDRADLVASRASRCRGQLQPRAIWLDLASATQADPPVLLLDAP